MDVYRFLYVRVPLDFKGDETKNRQIKEIANELRLVGYFPGDFTHMRKGREVYKFWIWMKPSF